MPHTLRSVRLDVVTLGTPVRYGWDADGYGNLLHFIHHRPVDGLPDDRAPFLPSAEDILQAKQGDCVQQLGIAGTNFTPPAWAWRTPAWAPTAARDSQAGLVGSAEARAAPAQ